MTITAIPNQFLWCEKYRPQTIDECILSKEFKEMFNGMLEKERLPNLLLCSTSPGTGKTTLAKALCNMKDCEYMFLNGSEENGIDTVRVKIKGFASTISLTDSKKVIIIDEFDHSSQNAQAALRSMMEEFSNNVSFIFTCNYLNKIIEPLRSRCTVIEFKPSKEEKQKMAMEFSKRVFAILDAEEVTYDKKAVAALIVKYFPDFRKVLNELQRHASNGQIDSSVLQSASEENIKVLIGLLKDKKFVEVRKWLGNTEIDSVSLYSQLYSTSWELMKPESIPELVLILANYQYKAAFVADAELNNMACLTEVMATCQWR